MLLQLGFTTAATLNAEFHGYPANLWWPWALLGAVIVLAAGFYGIRTSARLGTVLGVFEIGVFLVLAVFFVVHAGSNNTLSVFTTKYTPPAFRGLTGVIAGSVYTILAFGGFEGAAPLAEEARNPRRTIPRAVLLATLLHRRCCTCSPPTRWTSRSGPAKFHNFTTGTGAASWEGMARSLYGIFWFFVFLAIVNSTIANANAGVNVSTRTAYAMGRIGAFPRFLARVHPKHRSPVPAILAGLRHHRGGDPGPRPRLRPGDRVRHGRHRAGHRASSPIYILMNAACIGFFARPRPPRSTRGCTLVIPVLGILAFVPAWLTSAGIDVLSGNFITPLPPPYSYMGPGVAGFMIIGVIYLIYLYRRHPRRVVEVGLVHLDPLEEYEATDELTRRSSRSGRIPASTPGRSAARRRWHASRRPPSWRCSPRTASPGRVRGENDLVSQVCEFPYLNPQTGPFYIEGAEPGDTLAVHFVSIEPARDWGASTTVPLFGALIGHPRHRAAARAAAGTGVDVAVRPAAGHLPVHRPEAATTRWTCRWIPCTARSGSRQPTLRYAARWCPTRSAATWTPPRCGPGSPVTSGSTWRARCSRSATGTPGRARARPAGWRWSAP